MANQDSKMAQSMKADHREHCHRGRSSETFLDKNVILKDLEITVGEIVLDAGCGNGYMAKEFAKLTGRTGKVYAMDPDTVSVQTLRSETEGTVIEAFVGDITRETKLAASSIDLIFVSTVLHGFSETQMQGFLREVKRLLKPDGRLAIVEIKKEDTPFGPPLNIRFSPEELRQTIGWTPARFIHVGPYFYMQVFEA